MMLYLETAVYALQIASFFYLAAPVLARSERLRTLARNPAWVRSEPGFLARHGRADLRVSNAVGAALIALLMAAAITGSRPFLFAVHGLLFGAACLGMFLLYGRWESRLRKMIPPDPLRRASLRPRTLPGLRPAWPLALLGAAVAAILGLNLWGWLSGSMDASRALGNTAFIAMGSSVMLIVARYAVQRPALRFSEETDLRSRSLELDLMIGVWAFLAAVGAYHTLGSLGAEPLFAHPPTLIHAAIEGESWSWARFFERQEYRWVEIGASLVIALMGPLLALSPFHRRILSADLGKVRTSFEI
jgi:hypothetical protein